MLNGKIEQLVVGPVQTNCYLLINTKAQEALLVDPGADPEAIKDMVGKNSAVPKAILLTHGHFDHAGAAKTLGDFYQIPIYAHIEERKTLEEPGINLSGPMMGKPEVYHADEYLKDEQEIDLAGFHIRVLFTPGHTSGGCCYYIPMEDVLFSGDSLFCGSVGRTDFPGGSAATLVRGIKDKLMQLPEQTLVLTGHDARTTIEQERMYNPFL